MHVIQLSGCEGNLLYILSHTLDSTVDCGSLPNPVNGHVTLSGTSLGSTAHYICNPLYGVVGSTSRVCQSNGTWSKEESYCSLLNVEVIVGAVIFTIMLFTFVSILFVLCCLYSQRKVDLKPPAQNQETVTIDLREQRYR